MFRPHDHTYGEISGIISDMISEINFLREIVIDMNTVILNEIGPHSLTEKIKGYLDELN